MDIVYTFYCTFANSVKKSNQCNRCDFLNTDLNKAKFEMKNIWNVKNVLTLISHQYLMFKILFTFFCFSKFFYRLVRRSDS